MNIGDNAFVVAEAKIVGGNGGQRPHAFRAQFGAERNMVNSGVMGFGQGARCDH